MNENNRHMEAIESVGVGPQTPHGLGIIPMGHECMSPSRASATSATISRNYSHDAQVGGVL